MFDLVQKSKRKAYLAKMVQPISQGLTMKVL